MAVSDLTKLELGTTTATEVGEVISVDYTGLKREKVNEPVAIGDTVKKTRPSNYYDPGEFTLRVRYKVSDHATLIGYVKDKTKLRANLKFYSFANDGTEHLDETWAWDEAYLLSFKPVNAAGADQTVEAEFGGMFVDEPTITPGT